MTRDEMIDEAVRRSVPSGDIRTIAALLSEADATQDAEHAAVLTVAACCVLVGDEFSVPTYDDRIRTEFGRIAGAA